MSSPVRAYLQQQHAALPHAGLFITCGGPRADGALAQMSDLLSEPPLAQLTLPEADLKHGVAVQVGEFLERTLVAWESARRSTRAAG